MKSPSLRFIVMAVVLFSFSSMARTKRAKRRPASAKASSVAVKIYSEFVSFEDLLKNREKLARQPASFQVKARVIGIRRDIGLTDKEDDEAPRDIVINAGSHAGLSVGMKLSVKRHVPILDPYRENVQRNLEVEFARLKVVHVQEELAIARIQEVDDIDEGLAVGVRSVVLGDYVGTR